MSRVFVRDVFTLSQVAPPWVSLLGEHIQRVEEVLSERRVGDPSSLVAVCSPRSAVTSNDVVEDKKN